MKRRKALVLFLCSVQIFLLCCCAQNFNVPVTFPDVKNPGNTLVTYEPNRQVYILCENVYTDIYLSTFAGVLNFYIFTREKVDADTISVELPIKNLYKVTVSDCVDCRLTEIMLTKKEERNSQVISRNALPYYVYQAYKGVDFAGIVSERQAELAAGNISDGTPRWQALLKGEKDNFSKLQPEHLPEFYAYQVYVVIPAGPDKVAESFETMDVTIGNQIYTKQIGNITLIPEKIPTKIPIGTMQNEIADQFYTHAVGTTQQLYSNGIGYEYLLEFTASQPITLTGIHTLDRYTQLLNTILTLEKADGSVAEFRWDGQSPIDISEGQKLGMTVFYYNPNMDNLWYTAEMCIEVDYTMAEEIASIFLRRTLYPVGMNLHEAYAMIFEGLDMESYYMDFYYPIYKPWVEEYRTIVNGGKY